MVGMQGMCQFYKHKRKHTCTHKNTFRVWTSALTFLHCCSYDGCRERGCWDIRLHHRNANNRYRQRIFKEHSLHPHFKRWKPKVINDLTITDIKSPILPKASWLTCLISFLTKRQGKVTTINILQPKAWIRFRTEQNSLLSSLHKFSWLSISLYEIVENSIIQQRGSESSHIGSSIRSLSVSFTPTQNALPSTVFLTWQTEQ